MEEMTFIKQMKYKRGGTARHLILVIQVVWCCWSRNKRMRNKQETSCVSKWWVISKLN